MRIFLLMIKFLPYLTLPMMLLAVEVAVVFKRRGRKDVVLKAVLFIIFMFIITFLYFLYRWDKTAIPYLNSIFLHKNML